MKIVSRTLAALLRRLKALPVAAYPRYSGAAVLAGTEHGTASLTCIIPPRDDWDTEDIPVLLRRWHRPEVCTVGEVILSPTEIRSFSKRLSEGDVVEIEGEGRHYTVRVGGATVYTSAPENDEMLYLNQAPLAQEPHTNGKTIIQVELVLAGLRRALEAMESALGAMSTRKVSDTTYAARLHLYIDRDGAVPVVYLYRTDTYTLMVAKLTKECGVEVTSAPVELVTLAVPWVLGELLLQHLPKHGDMTVAQMTIDATQGLLTIHSQDQMIAVAPLIPARIKHQSALPCIVPSPEAPSCLVDRAALMTTLQRLVSVPKKPSPHALPSVLLSTNGQEATTLSLRDWEGTASATVPARGCANQQPMHIRVDPRYLSGAVAAFRGREVALHAKAERVPMLLVKDPHTDMLTACIAAQAME